MNVSAIPNTFYHDICFEYIVTFHDFAPHFCRNSNIFFKYSEHLTVNNYYASRFVLFARHAFESVISTHVFAPPLFPCRIPSAKYCGHLTVNNYYVSSSALFITPCI